MLVLTRRVGEIINIGDDIEILIGLVKGDQVKLCITAPKQIIVHRNEVFLAVKAGKTKEDRLRERMTVKRHRRIDKEAGNQIAPAVTIKKGKLNGL